MDNTISIDNSDNSVKLVHPSGELYEMPRSSVKEALGSGYRYPTADELTELRNEENYGAGFGNSAVALTLGAARTASFGLSDQALVRGNFVDPEVLKQVQERHPIASTVGEITGAIADPLSLVGDIGIAGKAVSKGLLGSAPEATNLAERVLQNTASKGIGSAVEGAAFGSGQVVSEEALGDPNLTAENVISQIGHSALYGGILGSALGLGEVVVPAAIGAAKKALSNTANSLGMGSTVDKIKDLATKGYSKAASIVSGSTPEEIKAAIKNRGVSEVPLNPEEVASALQKQYDAVEKAKSTAFEDIRPQETEKFVAGVKQEPALEEYQRMITESDRVIEEIRSKPDIYPQRYAAKLEEFTNRLNQGIDAETPPHELFRGLDDLKASLDKDIKYGKFPSAADQDAQELIGGLRRSVKESLENAKIWGEGGVRQAAFNDAASDYLSNLKDFQKRFMYKTVGRGGKATYKADPTKVQAFLKNADSPASIMRASALSKFNNSSKGLLDQIEESYKNLPSETFDKKSVSDLIVKNEQAMAQAEQQGRLNKLTGNLQGQSNNGILGGGLVAAGARAAGASYPLIGSLVAGYEALRNPGVTIQRLARLEDLSNRAMQQVAKATKAIARPAGQAAGQLTGYAASKLAFSSKAAYDKTTGEIQGLVGNPQGLVDKLSENTEGISSHAPQVAQAMQTGGARGLAFLQSKIPTSQIEGPLAPKYEPSKAEMSKFGSYYRAVENPMSVLQDAAKGQLTREGVEALGTVYPAFFKQAQTALLAHLSEVKGEVPYKNRMMLTMLLGKDMDGSLSPMPIMKNQMALGMAQMQQNQKNQAFMGNAPKARAKGLDNLGVSGRSMLPIQISANRGLK